MLKFIKYIYFKFTMFYILHPWVSIAVIYLTYLGTVIFIYAYIAEIPNPENEEIYPESNQTLSDIQKRVLVNNVALLNKYINEVPSHYHIKSLVESLKFVGHQITIPGFWTNKQLHDGYIREFLTSMVDMQPIHQDAGRDYLSAIYVKIRIVKESIDISDQQMYFTTLQETIADSLDRFDIKPKPPTPSESPSFSTTNPVASKLFLPLITVPLIGLILIVTMQHSII